MVANPLPAGTVARTREQVEADLEPVGEPMRDLERLVRRSATMHAARQARGNVPPAPVAAKSWGMRTPRELRAVVAMTTSRRSVPLPWPRDCITIRDP